MSLLAEIKVTRGSLQVDATVGADGGQTLGVVGPNGAGKSSIVGALSGLIPLEEGKIVLEGATLDDGAGVYVAPKDRNVGVVFQDLRLFPHLSAIDNVAFALRTSGVRVSEARRQANEALKKVGLSDRSEARPGELSGGEAQCVALARALIRNPRLLLLDEPLAALDIVARRRVRQTLRKALSAYEGVAVLVSHDPVDVMTLAGQIIVIEQGRTVQKGTPDEIRRRPLTKYSSELVGVNLFRGRLTRIEEGVAAIDCGDGRVIAATHESAPGPVIATLKPSDVSIHSHRPEGSARNVIAGTIATIDIGDRVRVTVEGPVLVVAELTTGSLRALELTEGQQVFASFKATEVSVTRD